MTSNANVSLVLHHPQITVTTRSGLGVPAMMHVLRALVPRVTLTTLMTHECYKLLPSARLTRQAYITLAGCSRVLPSGKWLVAHLQNSLYVQPDQSDV
jgi:hypothetical protein